MSSTPIETGSAGSSGRSYSWAWPAALAAISFLAYLPFFDNGFISDDWVILDRAQHLLDEPFHLFGSPPDQFRLTSYLCFLALGTVFDHQAVAFYLFAWMLHAINMLLLVHLARDLLGDSKAARTAGLCFAVIQNPHEVVAWLAAINESLMVLFLLLLAMAWMRGRYLWASAAFLAALFSKESALVALFLLPMVDVIASHRGVGDADATHPGSRGSAIRPRSDSRTTGQGAGAAMPDKAAPRWRLQPYAYLLVPLTAFAAAYLWAWQNHSMLRAGYYSFGFDALGVILNSLHRLAFPYLYLAVLVVLLVHSEGAATQTTAKRMRRGPASALPGVGRVWSAFPSQTAKILALSALCASIALLPYSFLTYQGHVPSRQTYLACLMVSLALGILVRHMPSHRLRVGFLALFVLGNAAYLWTVKDRQFEERAAPTTELRTTLAKVEPQPVLLRGFPLNPWIARLSVKGFQGWTGDELSFADEHCAGCLELRWNAEAGEYRLSP